MDLFDKMAQKISIGTNVVSKKTDEFIAATELRMNISKLENEIEEAIFLLGESVFNSYVTSNNMPMNEIQRRCTEIKRMYQTINKLRQSYNHYKGLSASACNICGTTVDSRARYCQNCGNQVR